MIVAGNKYITAEGLFKTMNGNTLKSPTPKQTEKIKRGLKKLYGIFIDMQVMQEIDSGYLDANILDPKDNRLEIIRQASQNMEEEKIIGVSFKDRLIDFSDAIIHTNKRDIPCMYSKAEPILLAYSRYRNQLVSIPAYALNIESVSLTDNNIVIKEYLAKEIVQLKRGHRNNNSFKFDTVFEKCRLLPQTDELNSEEKAKKEKQTKTITKRFRDDIFKMLEEWKQKGFIKDWHKVGEHPIKGFKIILEDPE